MASSFLSDFVPASAVKKLFPGREGAKASHETSLHLRNIYIVPTYAGLSLLGVLLLLLIAAINFQNALIYMVCFWLGSLLVINILYTFRNLVGLQIELLGAEPCFAGQNTLVSIKASSTRGNKEAIYIGWKTADLARLDLISSPSAEIKVAYPAPQRGHLKPPRLDVFTRYPSGLTIAWAYARLDITALVYPAPHELSAPPRNTQGRDESEDGVEIAGGVSDFSGIRPYQNSDNLRQIHWAKYAQTGKLYSKVFVDYASHTLWLDWADCPSGSVEQRLSHLCARVLAFHQEQKTFGLRLPNKQIEPGKGEAHRNACLTALALFPASTINHPGLP